MKPKNTESGVERTAADRMVTDQTVEGCTAADRACADCTAADRKKGRRKSAIQSAVLFTAIHLAAAGLLLWVRAGLDPAGFPAKLTLVLTGFELVSVIPLWFSLKERFKEIEGGEEDAAAQY